MYKKAIILFVIIVFSAVYISTSLIKTGQYQGHIIATRIPVEGKADNFNLDNIVPDYQNAQIVSIDPDNLEPSPKILTPEFVSACSPELSYDNQKIVFAGKKKKDDNWQIWLLNLNRSKPIQVTNGKADCFDPVFLPNGRVAFSRTWENEKLGKGHTLYSCNADGTDLNPITFHPHSDYASSILHDGRILMMSQQVFPEVGTSNLMALRPDGTKAELFYRIPDAYKIISQSRETGEHKIVFVATGQHSDKSNHLIQVDYNDPYNSPEVLLSTDPDKLNSAYPKDSTQLLLSYREDTSKPYGVYTYHYQKDKIEPAYSDNKHHLIEPIIVQEKPFIPKKLPSTLDGSNNTGIMICLDSDQSQVDSVDDDTHTIQVLGIDGLLNEFPVAEDGSFYIKLIAKTPVRFQSLNEQNEILRGPSSWIWLMPNERRGCVGCHEKKTIAPANKVPKAIHNPPVEITAEASSSFVKNVKENVSEGGDHEDN